ncbi:MAG: ATP phosphoribosyltransferase [Methanomicrobiales archaeon]|nr:ATP phosphoribosyltransferase [Methanomicrobiales archaeon]
MDISGQTGVDARTTCSGSVRIAIPNKGRIAAPVLEIMERSGLHLLEGGARQLISRTTDPHVEVLSARPIDIPEYVATGAADLGVTGHDMVCERRSCVEEILDLGIGRARLVLAVMEDSPVTTPADLANGTIATEFPSIARSFFQDKGIPVSVVQVGGACEVTPHLGIADAIIDLSSSGSTLAQNRLRVITEVLLTSTILIANPAALKNKADKIEEIRLALESVVAARGKCYLMMNAGRSSLNAVKAVLPGLSGPTVMEVASSEDLVAVHAVVGEEAVYRLITQLRRAGARDILVMPIARMIR